MGTLIRLSAREGYDEHSMLSSALTDDFYAHQMDSDRNNLFYDGGDSQWTEAELASLEANGNYKLTINVIRDAILTKAGQLTSAQPKLTCLPVGEEDNAIAGICDKLLDQMYRDSYGGAVLPEIALSGLKTNIAYAFVRGIGTEKVIFESLNYREVFMAPSKDAMFRDAEWIATRKWVPAEKIKAIFGVKDLVISSPFEWNTFDATYASRRNKLRTYDITRDSIEVVERWHSFVEKLPDGTTRKRIKKRVLLGYGHVYEEVLPVCISEYPIIPFYADYSDNEFKYGDVHHLRDPQRFLNKMFNETVRSAQAGNGGKLIVRKNEIPNGDVEEFGDAWAQTNAIVVLNPGAQEPKVIQPQPLNGAFFELYKDTKSVIDKQTQSATSGKYEDLALNPDSKAEWDSMITTSMRITASIWETFLSQLGKVALEHYQAYVDFDHILQIVDGSKYITTIKDAQAQNLDPTTEQGIALWSEEMIKQKMPIDKIEETIYKAKKAIDILDALSDLKREKVKLRTNVEVEPESYTSTAGVHSFRLIYSLIKDGILPPELAVDYLPIADKDAVKAKVGALQSSSRQIQQLNSELEEMSKRLEKSEAESTTKSKQIIDAKHEAGHDYRTKDTMMKKQFQKQMNLITSKVQSNEARLELKELLLTLKDSARDNPQQTATYLEQYLES